MNDSKFKTKKRTLIIIAVCAALALGVTGVFAWFTGSVEGIGASVRTGKIKVDFESYKYEVSADGESQTPSLVQYIDKHIDGTEVTADSVELANELQRSISILNDPAKSENPLDTVYFVIKKRSGSIPLDIQLGFNLAGLFTDQVNALQSGQSENINLEYAGGFWYDLKDITSAVSGFSGSDVKDKLTAYARANQENLAAQLPGDQSYSVLRINSITKENTSTALQTGDYCVFRLTMGLDKNASNAVQYQDQLFDVNVTLTAAQQGGLDSLYGTSDVYYVSNVDELEYFMSVYKPGDSLVITRSFDYIGDLIFSRPVNLTLSHNGVGSTLTVQGNLIFSYPYTDVYNVNTTNGGRIIVKKYQNAGGNFNIDIPKCSVNFTGTNNAVKGKADIYVQGDFTANTNCIPDSKLGRDTGNLLAGYGITINNTRILDGNGQDENQNLERIYLHDASMLNITAGTSVGEIYAGTRVGDTSVKQLVINNHGTVEQGIYLYNMSLYPGIGADFKDRRIPQIYISNFGSIQKGNAGASITLPANASPFDWVNVNGNTWITRELGASEEGVTGSESFKDANIFVRYADTYVVDVDGDGKNLRVLYTSFENDPDAKDFNLEQIFNSRYFNKPEINVSGSTSVEDIEKLTIATGNGKVLLTKDYAFLKTMTNLKELDLSASETLVVNSVAALPEAAFKDMAYLEHVSLPSNTTTLNKNTFANTQVTDLYLPAMLTDLKNDALMGVKYVHPQYPDDVVKNLRQGDATRYIFVPGELRAAYRKSGYAVEYVFNEAVLSEDGNFFYRLSSFQTAEIAVWVGLPYSDPMTVMGSFDFAVLKSGDDSYRIAAYDDYAFYKKANAALGSSERLTVSFSDQLYEIGVSAFEEGTGIGSVSFSQSSSRASTVRSRAFYNCSSITGNLALHNVSTVESYAFEFCRGISTVWGDMLTTAGYKAFADCSGLLAARFPNLVNLVPSGNDVRLFSDCPRLMAVEVGIVTPDVNLQYSFINDMSLVFINTYGRHSAGSDMGSSFYNTPGTTTDFFRVFVDSVTLDKDGKSFASKIDNAHRVDTGTFDPEDFFYYTRSDSTETPYTAAGVSTTLSDISCGGVTYGNYVFAANADGETAALIGCLLKEISGNYTVPSEISVGGKIYTVTAIGNRAYYHTDFVNASVTVPESISSIGEKAFYNRDGIVSVKILGQDCQIGAECFRYCDGIENVEISADGNQFGSYCFSECLHLESVSILGDGCLLGDYCFNKCDCLEKIEIAGDGCQTGSYCFNNCDKIKDVSIPGEGCRLGKYCFNDCESLVHLDLGGCTELGSYCFKSCINLETVIGSKVRLLCNGSFNSCSNLLAVSLPNVEQISTDGSYYSATFTSCPRLMVVDIGLAASDISGTSYGVSPLSGNSSLVTFNIHTENRSYSTIQTVFYNDIGSASKYYRLLIESISCLGDSTDTIASKITDGHKVETGEFMGDDYFYSTFAADEINEVPYKVTTSDGKVHSLRDIVYDTDAAYGDYVFAVNDESAKTVTLINCLLDEIKAAEGATVPYDYTVPSTVVKDGETYTVNRINNQAYLRVKFSNVNLIVPETIEFIGDKVFYDNDGIAGVRICGDNCLIGKECFRKCDGIESVEISGNGCQAGNYCFAECGHLKSIGITGDDFAAGSYCFYNCDMVTSARFTGSRCKLGNYCFDNCGGLVDLDLGGCTELGQYCFRECSLLKTVCGENVRLIHKGCFNKCADLIALKFINLEQISSNGTYYIDHFASCPKLMVLDLGLVVSDAYGTNYGPSILSGDGNLVLYSIHTETHTAGSVLSVIYNDHGSGSAYLRMLVDSKNILCTTGEVASAKITYGNKVSTGIFDAGQYLYYSREAANEIPHSVTTSDGVSYTLSDISYLDSHAEGTAGSGVYGNYVFAVNDTNAKTVTLLSCLLDEIRGEYTVPAQIEIGEDTYTVNEINEKAFIRVNFTDARISIPSSIRSIGYRAFYDRDGIIELSIAGNNCKIDSDCFRECSGLTDLIIAGENCSVGSYAFSNCSSLSSISFSGSGCRLGSYSFSACNGIINLNLGGCIELKDYAFYACSRLQTICGENVEQLGYRVFYNCADLIAVRLPRLERIASSGHSQIFQSCPNLIALELGVVTENITAGGGNYLLDGNKNILLYNIHTETHPHDDILPALYSGDGISSDHYKIFIDSKSCAGDTSVTLYEKLGNGRKVDTGIFDAGMFFYYTYEQNGEGVNNETPYTVKTSDGVEHSLRDIVYNTGSETEKVAYGDYVFAVNDEDAKTATLIGCLLKSISGSYTVPTQVVKDGETYTVSAIHDQAYRYVLFNDVDVTIPAGIKSAGARAFYDRDGIISVTVDSEGCEIGSESFRGCDRISVFTVNSDNCITGNYSFSECTNLQKVSIIGSGFTAGSYSFYNSNRISDLKFLGAGCVLEDHAFYDCDGIVDLNLGTCTELGQYCFSGCSVLQSVWGENVSEIDYAAFYNCADLMAVSLPRLEKIASSGNSQIFESCPKIIAFDVGLVTMNTIGSEAGNYTLNKNTSIVLYNIHTERHPNGNILPAFYGDAGISSDHYRMYIDSAALIDGTLNTLESKITNGRKITTGRYDAGQFFYYTRGDANETPWTVKISDGSVHSLRDISYMESYEEAAERTPAYGDYVFAVNDEEAKTVTLIGCLLKSIEGTYRVPETVEHNGNTYTVNEIWQYAYRYVSFASGTSVILPEGIGAIGEAAFYGAKNITRITIENNESYITASNIMNGSGNINADLKVLVGENAYNNIYTAEATPWGGIARSYFVSIGIDFQPVAGGPVFHIDNYKGGYQVVSITNVSGSVTRIDVPSDYEGKNIIAMGQNTFSSLTGSNVTALALPAVLEEFNADMSLAPQCFAEFIIPASADCFSTVGGLLLSSDGTMLIKVPRHIGNAAMTLPENIKVVASGAFSGVDNLISITVPEECTVAFGDAAFDNCGSLTTLRFEAQAASWFTGSGTFVDCENMETIQVPAVSADLYSSNAPLDAQVRGMMSSYERSYHKCVHTAADFTWYISYDMRNDSTYGREAVAMYVCPDCGNTEYYHAEVERYGHAAIDINGDDFPDFDISFLPFRLPEPTQMMLAAPDAVMMDQNGGLEQTAENGETTTGSGDGDDGNGGNGENEESNPEKGEESSKEGTEGEHSNGSGSPATGTADKSPEGITKPPEETPDEENAAE